MNATTRFAVLLATCGGIGYVRLWSGTFGSLAGVLTGYLAVAAGLPVWSLAVAAAVVFWPACWAAGVVERHLAKTDPSEVVVDEVVGQWVVLSAINPLRWEHWLAAFLLFRLFDAAKPYPIRVFERLPGGYGVLADDAAAGLCGMIVIAGLRWLTLG
jgi:phosphatidylglycerophosphatase A